MWRTKSHVHKRFKLSPSAHVALVNIGDRVGIAGADIAMRRMMIGKRPVNEIEVEIVEPEVVKGFLAGGDNVSFSVPVVPDLGCDPKLVTFDAGAHDVLKRLTDQVFVAVDGGAVEVAIAERRGVLDGGRDSPAWGTWSEPKVPRPMAGILAPERSWCCGTEVGSIASAAGNVRLEESGIRASSTSLTVTGKGHKWPEGVVKFAWGVEVVQFPVWRSLGRNTIFRVSDSAITRLLSSSKTQSPGCSMFVQS